MSDKSDPRGEDASPLSGIMARLEGLLSTPGDLGKLTFEAWPGDGGGLRARDGGRWEETDLGEGHLEPAIERNGEAEGLRRADSCGILLPLLTRFKRAG